MFDPDFAREIHGSMVASAIVSIASVLGAALIGAAVLYWWITTRG